MSTVHQASHWLKQGGLLAYPTESVWGIGCDAYNQQAVQQILAIKQRPSAKGLIVVTDDGARIAPLLAGLTASQKKRVVDSWHPANNKLTQQAQTWLLPIPDKMAIPDSLSLDNLSLDSLPLPDNQPTLDNTTIPNWITGKHDSVAVRVIAHPLIQKLCKQMVSASNPFGFLVSTSCNPSGQSPAINFDQAYAYFGDKKEVAYLQGETLGYTLPSQINDAITGQQIR